ncbi:porin family protein [Winogradskyella sp. PG-2]|uniref:porin family protein n=1 Tax=Winogradskyella sp. PG-2 TaxID=754409 RepID=UPI000458886C|nr:porin family protein [Winogradskyella sp. PG-2]BAO77117.1 hypothetical protein WPG_2887 [Winogradskyella sp. PG-2]
MKNLCFTTLLIFTISIATATAQDSTALKKKKFDFGIRHGYSIWDVNASNSGLSDTNLYVGLFLETRLSKKLSIQLEANYSHSNLLELPVLLKYRISDKFEIYGGAQLEVSLDDNIQEAFKNKRLGTSLVLGAQYNINTHWFIDARYTHGLTNQIRVFNGFDTESIYGKKSTVNFGVGYKF